MIFYAGGLLTKLRLFKVFTDRAAELGTAESAVLSDKIRSLTFKAATISGQSVALEDIFSLVPITDERYHAIRKTMQFKKAFYNGQISNTHRHEFVTREWSHMTAMGDNTENYFIKYDPENILGGISFSGARGSLTQAKQVIGARGFSIDIYGNIKRNPIRTGLCNGMDTLDSAISCYGARKGLIDTALRTADAGYLTRRLVDSSQDIVVHELDCGTYKSISVKELLLIGKISHSAIKIYLVGRLLGTLLTKSKKHLDLLSYCYDVFYFDVLNHQSSSFLLFENTLLTNKLLDNISDKYLLTLKIRTPFTCYAITTICRNCYGTDLSSSRIVSLGTSVGVIAAQSIGEPGTQMILRTFHSGGVVSGNLRSRVGSLFEGKVVYGRDIETSTVFIVKKFIRRRGFVIKNKRTLFLIGKTNSRYMVNPGMGLFAADGEIIFDHQPVFVAITRRIKQTSEERKRLEFDNTREMLISAVHVTGKVKKTLLVGINSVWKKQKFRFIDRYSFWILKSQWFKLPQNKNVKLRIKPGLKLFKGKPLASIEA